MNSGLVNQSAKYFACYKVINIHKSSGIEKLNLTILLHLNRSINFCLK